jgi:UDP-glucuronate 4-epimerase
MSMFRFTKWICEGEKVRLNGDGEQSRGFTYVDDIVRGTLAALRVQGYEVINLGGNEVVSMNVLIGMLAARLGKEAIVDHLPANTADMLTSLADGTKAKELLGWEPQVKLEEGLKRLVEWYEGERGWAKQLSDK